MLPKLWLDIKSPSDAHFMRAVFDALRAYERVVTVRDRAEAVALTRGYGLPAISIGQDDPRILRKLTRYMVRVYQLHRELPPWNISINFNNMNANALAALTRRPSITFMDNDLDFYSSSRDWAKRGERFINLRASRIICPSCFPIKQMVDIGANPDAIKTYNGFKEDLYVADFEPEPHFHERLPFKDYVVVRPEALDALYVHEKQSIVPELLHELAADNVNVVYLPRIPADRPRVPPDVDNVYVPDVPLNGLQLAWHAKCVLTGSGSLAREAACLGVPAVSFFPDRLLAVDRRMVGEGRVFHSRSPAEIRRRVGTIDKEATTRDIDRSRKVREEILGLLRVAIQELTQSVEPQAGSE